MDELVAAIVTMVELLRQGNKKPSLLRVFFWLGRKDSNLD